MHWQKRKTGLKKLENLGFKKLVNQEMNKTINCLEYGCRQNVLSRHYSEERDT